MHAQILGNWHAESSGDRESREPEELQMLREKIVIQQEKLETLEKHLDIIKGEKNQTKIGGGAGETPQERGCCSIGWSVDRGIFLLCIMSNLRNT